MNAHGFAKAINMIKNELPEMQKVMTDIALDPCNGDGRDGLVDRKTGKILNDETLDILAEMAFIQARAAADIFRHK